MHYGQLFDNFTLFVFNPKITFVVKDNIKENRITDN